MIGRDNGRLELKGIDLAAIHDGRDENIALEYVVTTDTYSYAAPNQVGHDADVRAKYPLLTPSSSNAGVSAAAAAATTTTTVKKTVNQEVMEPITSGSQTVLPIEPLQSGRKIFARKDRLHPNALQILTFSPDVIKREGMEETGFGIQAGKRAFIDIKNCEQDREAGETFEPFPDDMCLFPNIDLLADIAQYKLGDCYLLASIQAILALPNGSDLIKGMMIKDGKDTIVRLFHPDTHQPVYIRVSNSVYKRTTATSPKLTLFGRGIGTRVVDDTVITHRAPWVHILEKAYVAFSVEQASAEDVAINKHIITTPAFRKHYGNGGQSVTALPILTGMTAEDKTLNSPDRMRFDLDLMLFCCFKWRSYGSFIGRADGLIKCLDSELGRMDKSVFDQLILKMEYIKINGDAGDINYAFDLLELSDELKAMLKEHIKIEDVGTWIEYFKEVRKDATSGNDLTQAIGGYSQYLLVGKAVDMDKVGDYRAPVSSAGSNVPRIDEATERLNRMLEATLDSNDTEAKERAKGIIKMANLYILRQVNDDGGLEAAYDGQQGSGLYAPFSRSVFESIKAGLQAGKVMTASSHQEAERIEVKGIYNRHAYTVMGVREEGKLKFIRLRNPWGHTGHVSEWDAQRHENVSKESTEHGEFEIELSEFMRSFRQYTIGQSDVLQAIEQKQIKNDREQLERDRDLIVEQSVRLAEQNRQLAEQHAQLRAAEAQMQAEAFRQAQEKLRLEEESKRQAEERLQLQQVRKRLDEERNELKNRFTQLEEDRRPQDELEKQSQQQQQVEPLPAPPFTNRRLRNQRSLWSYRYEIMTATAVTGLAFAGAGFALGWFFAPATFGLSVPVMAAIAGVAGFAVGAVLGLAGSMIASRLHAGLESRRDRARDQDNAVAEPLIPDHDNVAAPLTRQVVTTQLSTKSSKDKGKRKMSSSSVLGHASLYSQGAARLTGSADTAVEDGAVNQGDSNKPFNRRPGK